MFVLQIGCRAQTPECNVKTDDMSNYRGILLQYTTNKVSFCIIMNFQIHAYK